jgi:hypothetical protein
MYRILSFHRGKWEILILFFGTINCVGVGYVVSDSEVSLASSFKVKVRGNMCPQALGNLPTFTRYLLLFLISLLDKFWHAIKR